jgi:methylglutamate dehydrogenase subunit D
VSDANSAQWRSEGAWAGIVAPGSFGNVMREPAIRVEGRENLTLATVISRKGRERDVHEILWAFAGIAPPTTPKISHGTCDLVWSGPGQWLLVTEEADALAQLTVRLAGQAAVSDQSSSRAVIRVSGPRVRDVLAKGCMIDLHPRAFSPGDAAMTAIALISVQIWQLDDKPTYDLLVPRSMAASFWSWFGASAAEFGYAVA